MYTSKHGKKAGMLIVRDRVVELVHRPASHSPPQACIDRRRRHLLPWRDRASGRRSRLAQQNSMIFR